jgi:hypothetical protein
MPLFFALRGGVSREDPLLRGGRCILGTGQLSRSVLDNLPPGNVGLVGPGVVHLRSSVPPEETVLAPPLLLYPSASVMGSLAFSEKREGGGGEFSDLLYGRDSVCS